MDSARLWALGFGVYMDAWVGLHDRLCLLYLSVSSTVFEHEMTKSRTKTGFLKSDSPILSAKSALGP
jgi:hypothetical protein